MRRVSGPWAVIILGIAIIVAAGGTAIATAPSGGSFRACVAKHRGTLYVAKHCHRHDRRVKWSVKGPAGRPGTNGAPGIGPAFYTYHDGNVDFTGGAPSSYTPILTLNIPAPGSYVVVATGTFLNNAPGGQQYCRVVAGNDGDSNIIQGLNNGEYVSVSLQVAHTFAAPGTARFECSGNLPAGTAQGSIYNSRLIATQVSSITATPG